MSGGARGRFVVLEGVEGAGKSTQVRLLASWLERIGVPHVVTREPGGTEAGEAIRHVLLEGGAIDARTELLLMLAARAALVDTVVRPALAAGKIVLADRYELSTFAYQGAGRGLPLETVRTLNAFATGGLRPDLTFVLDVPLAQGVARRGGEEGGGDRIERAGTSFHARVGEAYSLLAREGENVVTINGRPALEEVNAEIRAVLEARFPETFDRAEG